ncbi:MAG: hypothetical protein RLZ18_795 [Actinomycetota bacterium]|jgi:hypothetical protein
MAEAIHTHNAHDGLSGASYGAVAMSSSRPRTTLRASVFLLAGALVILSVVFGSNEDSSTGTTQSVAAVTSR